MSKKLKITLCRSVIGRLYTQKRVVKALGIRKTGQSVIHDDTPWIRGMANKVRHLVTVEEINGDA
jgi:large subunit ribosomal protein L30